MKKEKLYILFLMLSVIGCSNFFTSCDDNYDEFEANLPYLFRPVNFNATMEGTVVTLSWAAVDSAQSYTVEIYKDSLLFSPQNLVLSETVDKKFIITELQGATLYSARVRANASQIDMDSKFNETLTFKTPAENLFNGFTSSMTALGTADMKWLPGANVTSLVFINVADDSRKEYSISLDEKVAGEKICTNLPNATYNVELHNNGIVRGKTTVKIEGDIFLNSSDDLKAAMETANSGDVIILNSGVYPISSGTFRFDKNIKLKGLDVNNKPVLCMKDGASSTASMFGFTAGTTFDYVAFENLDITGWVENSQATNKIGYLFNNNTAMTVGSVTFTNCNIHNLANTPMRLQGNVGQRIGTVGFAGCIINDIGFGSTYAIVNVNTATDIIDNIVFKNSTIYNFRGSLILRQNGTVAQVSIDACTIDQGMMDTAARYLVDLNSITNTPSFTLTNSILGQTSTVAGGIRPITDYPITGCYYTTDYYDDALIAGASSSIKAKMKAYSGKSTDLWTNPSTGDFHFKDATFAGKSTAGDPRWK